MEYQEKTIVINGKTYQYIDTQKGKNTIVALHGLSGGKQECLYLLKPLLGQHRVVSLDLPGHNGVCNHKYHLEAQAQYVVDFIKYLKLTNFTLFGFSYGGLVALATIDVLKQPIPAIIWSTPVYTNSDNLTNQAKFSLWLMSKVNRNWYKKILTSKTALWFFRLSGLNLSVRDIVDGLLKYENSQTPTFCQAFYQLIPLPKNSPLLFLFGTHDALTRERAYHTLKLISPKHRKVLIANGGHFGTTEGRQKAIEEIKKFLENKLEIKF